MGERKNIMSLFKKINLKRKAVFDPMNYTQMANMVRFVLCLFQHNKIVSEKKERERKHDSGVYSLKVSENPFL
jgi:hypothetical protein